MDFGNLSPVILPKVDSLWSYKDYLGAYRVRLSIGRNRYQVKPGLYKLGNPDNDSEVIVTSNYKLSFDIVRRNLTEMNVWILVLQTFGINVWCAAGKGTFGTDELIKQLKDSELKLYVSHNRIIVPQLGAPGVSGHKVKKATGFSVKFGPVRAEDIKDYIGARLKKSEIMRSVQFNFLDRLLLTPVEIVNSLRYLLYAIILFFLISGIQSKGFSFSVLWQEGIQASFFLLLSYLAGAFIAPVLLPWLPFRYFGGKGFIVGFVLFGIVASLNFSEYSIIKIIGWLLLSGAISSFLAMNFTGASTYTSFSGVKKEMKLFVPVQIVFTLIGLSLVILSKFV